MRHLLIFALVFLTVLFAQAQGPFIPPNHQIDLSKIKQSRPRVLVGDFEIIKSRLRNNPIMQEWLNELQKETSCDAIALNYRLTGNKALIKIAIDSALQINLEEKIKKGPHHYGKSIQYLGCTYDWLYDFMTPEQKALLLSKLIKGLNAYLNDPDKTNFHNMNHCLNAGAIVAAIAIADDAPTLAKKSLETAINTINLKWYQPDGVTPEGPHYMNWSSLIMISGLASLDIAFNEGFGLSTDKGIMGYGDFMINVSLPGKGIAIKYSDCYTNLSHYNMGQFYWIANKFIRPDIAQFALENESATATGENPDYSGKLHQLLWFQPENIGSIKNPYLIKPFDKQFNSAALAIMRGGWNDENTVFAGLKGTDDYHQANYYHRHTNTGTFFLNALGEEWTVDLGLEDYALPDYNSQPRLYYKLRPEGHNCNIINPETGIDQLGWEKCPIINEGNDLKSSFAILDMTPDYKNLVKSAKRGMKLFDNRQKVLLQDEFIPLDGQSINSYWFMHTEAGVEIANNGRSAILYKGKERLFVYLSNAPEDAKISIMSTEPMIYTKPVDHKQDWTFGTKKLCIHSNIKGALNLTVVFVPLHDGEEPIEQELKFEPLANWKIIPKTPSMLDSIFLNNKVYSHFDPRQLTYTVAINENKLPNLFVSKKGAEVKIIMPQHLPGKAIIEVTEKQKTKTNYTFYFRNDPIKIISSSLHEYSSWDESFANHRVMAPKIKPKNSIIYKLNNSKTIAAATIGFVNQNSNSYYFKIFTSTDSIIWKEVFKGNSLLKPNVKMPMPQKINLKNSVGKYVKIFNASDKLSFAIDVANFHESDEKANVYLNTVFKENLFEVKLTLPYSFIKSGEKIQISIFGRTNYGEKIDLTKSNQTWDIVDKSIASIDEKGMITGLQQGKTFATLILKKDHLVFHKQLEITIKP